MNKSRNLTTLVFMFLLAPCQLKAQLKFEKFKFEEKDYAYGIQLPTDFDPTKTYPVLIGPSEVEGKKTQSFYWRGVTDTQGWILVDYKIYDAASRVDEVKALLETLKTRYKVEGSKFHTVCFSANSASIFDLVMEMPAYFAGITGMAGNPGTSSKDKLARLKGIKVQFVVGDQDSYWMGSAKNSHASLKEIGVDSSIEIVKNGKHVLSDLIGEGFLSRANRLRN